MAHSEKSKAEKVKKIKVKVIGVGDGGTNIVSDIALKLEKARFLAANTDSQSLAKKAKRAETLIFGQNLTSGLGTGMDPELGERAALEARERIKRALAGSDLCIFVSTLGGGTGSGAMPVFAKISRNLGNLNYGIFTLPFRFEGKKRMEIAKASLEKMRSDLEGFSVIENEKIFQIIDKKTSLRNALFEVNKILTQGLEGLLALIYHSGLINIDFADIRTILKSGDGLSYLVRTEAVGQNRLRDVIKKALNSPLYSYGIEKAKGVLFNITGGKDLGLSEVAEISKNIFNLSDRSARIVFGVSESKERGRIGLTILATGCRSEFSEELFSEKEKALPKKARVKIKEKKTDKTLDKKKKDAQNKGKKEIKRSVSQIRKNALQLKKEAEKMEREMLERERFWETPALFRRGRNIEQLE